MNDYLKKFIENQKAQKRHNRETEISSTFNIAIKDDKLWLTHNGDAIKEIDGNTTADTIVAELNNFKATAIKYK